MILRYFSFLCSMPEVIPALNRAPVDELPSTVTVSSVIEMCLIDGLITLDGHVFIKGRCSSVALSNREQHTHKWVIIFRDYIRGLSHLSSCL